MEKSDFRLSWRISLFVSCPRHACLFSHLCGQCKQHFSGLKHLDRIDLSRRFDLAAKCSLCSEIIALGNLFTPVVPEIAELEAIHMALIRHRPCRSYFPVPHWVPGATARNLDCKSSQLLRSMVARQTWESCRNLPRFERCEPTQRQSLLMAVVDLFKDWPNTFVENMRCCKPLITNANRAATPKWFDAAIGLARGERRRSIHCAIWFQTETS